MTYSNALGMGVLGCAAWLAVGCGAAPRDAFGSETQNADGVAVLSAELSQVPLGVTCVQFALSGSTSATQNHAVTAGTAPVKLSLGTLPAGSLTITPKAFNVACASVTASTVPSWIGAGVTVTLNPGQVTEINLTLRANLPVSASVDFLANAVSVSVGDSSSFAILSDGTLRAWGAGTAGQLGNGASASSSTPVAVSGLTGVKAVGAGLQHACALLSDGTIKCWGGNTFGQLGNGTTMASNTPATINTAAKFRGLMVGQHHACGISSTLSGTSCWGLNSSGQLCNGTTNNSSSPVVGSPLTLPDVLAAGPVSTTTLAFTGNLSAGCGWNGSGLLGNNSPSSIVTSGTNTGFTANGAAFVVAAAAGWSHACVVEAAAGKVMCAGNNISGQLGFATGNSTSQTPVTVLNFNDVTAITAGASHTCALKADGSAWCWGLNASGQLGDGTGTNRITPTAVKGLSSGVVSIAAGNFHTCAVKNDGTVWCWGENGSGQLGDGSLLPHAVPARVLL